MLCVPETGQWQSGSGKKKSRYHCPRDSGAAFLEFRALLLTYSIRNLQATRWWTLSGSVYLPWVMHFPAVSPADRMPCGLFLCAMKLSALYIHLQHLVPGLDASLLPICGHHGAALPQGCHRHLSCPRVSVSGMGMRETCRERTNPQGVLSIRSCSGIMWHSLALLSPWELIQRAAVWTCSSSCMVKIKSPLQMEYIVFHHSEILHDCNYILSVLWFCHITLSLWYRVHLAHQVQEVPRVLTELM